MNYWLLTSEYPPAKGGGIGTYCVYTSRMLSEKGHKVSVFVPDETIEDILIQDGAVRVIRFNPYRDNISTLGYTALLSYAFASVVKKMVDAGAPPDLIEAQDYLGIGYYITQQKHLGYIHLKNIPILITLHSPAFIYLNYNRVPLYRFPDFWTGEMEKQSIAAADGLISPSNAMVEEYEKYMPLARPHRVIANPFSTNEPASQSFVPNTIIFYGKLSAQKGSFAMLADFKKMWDEGFPHSLQVIGGTDIVYHPEMQTMEQLVRRDYGKYINKGLLQLHGRISQDQIGQRLADAHVIIVPSLFDNMPYVIMEAMSLGKIVLASDSGGQREMIEEAKTGFLFKHKHAGDFASQLNKILSLPEDKVMEIGEAARAFISRQYGFEKIYSEKLDWLDKVSNSQINSQRFPFLHQEPIKSPYDSDAVSGLLSVVIPYYNMANYIRPCVESVMTSTYKPIEILIIDDGSTEENEILKELENMEDVRVFRKENTGLAATRNYGAKLARGEFLAFLDADDLVAPSYYEKAIHILSKSENVFFTGAWTQYFGERKELWPTFTPQPPYALLHNPVNSSSLVYKKKAFLDAGLNDEKVGYGVEDYESVVSLLSKGFNGVVIPEPLFYYRVRKGSMFRQVTREKLLHSNRYIADKHASYYDAYALELIHLLNANGPGYLYDNPTIGTRVSVKTIPGNAYLGKLKNAIQKRPFLKKWALKLLQFTRQK